MDYRVKNITTEYFSFEGVNIAPGQVSEELKPEVYQRLLALYWHTKLEPMPEPVVAEAAPAPEEPAREVVPAPEVAEAPAAEPAPEETPAPVPAVEEESKPKKGRKPKTEN